jgi:hypothetical protein
MGQVYIPKRSNFKQKQEDLSRKECGKKKGVTHSEVRALRAVLNHTNPRLVFRRQY